MPKFTVYVELGFKNLQAASLDQACQLAEQWCDHIARGPDALADSIRSYAPEAPPDHNDT